MRHDNEGNTTGKTGRGMNVALGAPSTSGHAILIRDEGSWLALRGGVGLWEDGGEVWGRREPTRGVEILAVLHTID